MTLFSLLLVTRVTIKDKLLGLFISTSTSNIVYSWNSSLLS